MSDKGREQAKVIGKAFKMKNIPVSKVLASPYCRAKDTAQLAFGSFDASKELRYLSGAKPEDKGAVKEGTMKLLGMSPEAGKNMVLISHTSNLKEAAGVWPREPAVAVVFKPDGSGGFKAVAKIEPSKWAELAK